MSFLHLRFLTLQGGLQLLEGRTLGRQPGIFHPQLGLELPDGLALAIQRLLLHYQQAALGQLLPVTGKVTDEPANG